MLYPNTRFPFVSAVASPTTTIRLGTLQSAPDMTKYIQATLLAGPESYAVTTAEIDGRPCGMILGADPAGVVYGVYGLLRNSVVDST